MKKIFIVIVLCFSAGSNLAQNCIDFNSTSYNLNNWSSVATGTHSIQTDGVKTRFLQLLDDDGGSYESNSVDFGGNWLLKGENGCLCFDYYLKFAEYESTLSDQFPKLALSGTNGIYARFVANPLNPGLKNKAWRNYCLPIGLCVDNKLPSNAYGVWEVYGNLQSDPCTTWNTLIQDVQSLILYTDYHSMPSEIIGFDNFCWTCSTLPCRMSLDAVIKNEICETSRGSIQVTPNYGLAPYTYLWSNGNNTSSINNLTSGNYTVTVTDRNNCTATKNFTIKYEACAPNPCCQNKFSVVSPTVVPPSYPYDGGTYGVENFNVNVPNNIPITEIKVNVESFEIISDFKDCVKCDNKPATLGSVLGVRTIGSGANTLALSNQPYGNSNNSNNNTNELIWSNPNGVTLSTTDKLRITYVLPADKDITCCANKAKVCIRISWKDVNCGYCEVFTCSTIDLRNSKDLRAGFQLPNLLNVFLASRGNTVSPPVDGF